MAQFVLVHGGWVGGWFWERVVPLLTAAGHSVLAPSLTGHGDRAHLADPAVSMQTHVDEVAAAIVDAELHDVVLVGHSYGGIVITAIAEQIPERLSHLIYLDAFVPHDGDSLASLVGPRLIAAMEYVAQQNGDGWRVPLVMPLDWLGFNDPAQLEAFNRRLTPGILNVGYGTVTLRDARAAALPRCYVACMNPAMALLASSRERARQAGWRFVTIDAGHAAPLTHPREIAAMLAEIISVDSRPGP